jgi:hypothetical protein
LAQVARCLRSAEAKTEESTISGFSAEWSPHTGGNRAKFMSMHLINRYLIGVYLTGVHLMGVYLMGVHLKGVFLIGVYFTGVYLIYESSWRRRTRVARIPISAPRMF